jgi:hypothetical protein
VDAGASPALFVRTTSSHPSKYRQKGATGGGRIHASLLLLFFQPVCHPQARPPHPLSVMSANPINNEREFAAAATEHWRQLGLDLKADVERFNQSGGSASFSETADGEYRVSNSGTGLEVTISADPYDHIARYEFTRTNNHSAGAPEGGILSMRMDGHGGVEFFSSDETVTAEAARKLLLDPVFNPATT